MTVHHFAPLHRAAATVALTSLFFVGCGGTTGSTNPNAQTTVDDWSDYCIATFTESYPVMDSFGDLMFQASPGDQFVIASFESTGAPELLYLHSTGPESFDVETESGALPFTSNCTAGNITYHYAVFSDVTVFADEELTTPICDLMAGAVHVRDQTTGAGYGITDSGVGSSHTYQVMLNAFAADCGGADQGYVSVPQTSLFGYNTWLVPIQMIVGPG